MKLGQELRNNIVREPTEEEKSALYWVRVRVAAGELFEQAKKACREANLQNKLSLGFGEGSDKNVMERVATLLREEDLNVKIHYHEGSESACLHEDRASYYRLEISW